MSEPSTLPSSSQHGEQQNILDSFEVLDIEEDEGFLDWLSGLIVSFAWELVPSFIQKLINPTVTSPEKPHAIAALDGLRGWACLLVFNFHFLFTYTWKTSVGWGFAHSNWGFHQLPIIHMLFSGHVMVAIFFVLSGYVLTHKPFKLLRASKWEQFYHTLASSVFRRALRLYVPSIAGLCLVFVATRMGAFRPATRVINEGRTIMGVNEQHPPYFPAFTTQFWDFYLTVVHLIDPWNWALYYNLYNPHLWTIPVEFRCSMFLFVALLAFSRLKLANRMVAVPLLIIYCIRWGRWDVVLFLSGMLLSEIDVINGTWDPPSSGLDGEKPKDDSQRKVPPIFWKFLFVVGLYLGSSPNTAPGHTPGFKWLYRTFTPKTYPEPHRFLQSVGAITIVACVNHSKDLQKLFTTRFSQYLGKISFAFYIVHGPILHSLGYTLMNAVWKRTGKQTNFEYCMGVLIGWSICLPICIWAADVFWRLVDTPSVKFSRWFENRLIRKIE